MSDPGLTVPEIEELLGAYALDAVDADERAAVDAHLAQCPRCRAELAGHLEVASWMAGGGSRAPEGIWDRIADSLDSQTPALRLTAADLDDARRLRGSAPTETPAPPSSFVGASAGGSAHASGADGVGGAGGAGGAAIVDLAGRSRRRIVQTLGAAVGVAAAVILLLGIVVARQENRLDDMSRDVAAVDIQRAAGQAMADPEAVKIALSPPEGGAAKATVVVMGDGAGFVLGTLPALPDEQTYQLWGIQDDRVISLGVLGPAPSVAAFPTGGVAFTTYALTVEAAGGVPQSANDPVALGSV